MVYTVRLASANADFNIMREASLQIFSIDRMVLDLGSVTLIAACNDLAISLS